MLGLRGMGPIALCTIVKQVSEGHDVGENEGKRIEWRLTMLGNRIDPFVQRGVELRDDVLFPL